MDLSRSSVLEPRWHANCPTRVVHQRLWLARATNGATSTIVEPPANASEPQVSACPVLSALRPLPPPRYGILQSMVNTNKDPNLDLDLMLEGRTVANGRVLGFVPVVLVGGMAAYREAVSQEAAGHLNPFLPPGAHRLLGEESVSFATGDQHRFLRKVMAPALGPEAIEGYLPDIHAIVTDTLDSWAATSAKNQTSLAGPGLKAMTLQIIATVVIDRTLTSEEMPQIKKDFTQWMDTIFTPFAYDMWPFPFHASMRARERLVAWSSKKVAEAREALAQGGATGARNTLTLLLTTAAEEGRTLTDEQVIDNMLTLLFTGYDTTATQLARLLSDLATYPEVLDRVRAEQARVVQKHGPAMTPAALRDMQYTAAVLAEVMRTAPIVPGQIRQTQSDIGVDGNLIPKDQVMVLSISYLMRKDPRWPEASLAESDPMHPSRFNPDRFMTAEGSKQGAQIPFGIGQRSCAGIALAQAEAKVFLATVARGYRIYCDTNTDWPGAALMRPRNGLPVFVERL